MLAPGFDRERSNLGYTPDNVLPCCTQCNYMKLTWPEDQFFDKAFKLVFNFDPPQQTQAALARRYPDGGSREFEFVCSDGSLALLRVELLKIP